MTDTVAVSRLLRLRRKAVQVWTLRSRRLLAWQDEHGIGASFTSAEWHGLWVKVRRAEERMLRLRDRLRAAGWKPTPLKGARR